MTVHQRKALKATHPTDQNISGAHLYPGYSNFPNNPKPNTSESAKTQDIRSINNSFDPYYQPEGSADTSVTNPNLSAINSREIDEILQEINEMAVATPTIPISIKYALEAVPTFDGHNIPLSHFLEGCQEAEQMMPVGAQQSLALILRNKLRGEARRAIQGVQLKTMTEFGTFLKSLYAPAKSAYQLKGELGGIFQAEDESVLNYANRVKDIGNRIFEAHEIENEGVAHEEFKTKLDLALVDCFVRGLLREIENKITLGLSYEKTMHKAIEIERQLRTKEILRKPRSSKYNDCSEKQQYQSEGIHHMQSRSNLITCQICNMRGHIAADCLQRFKRFDDLQNTSPTEWFCETNNI